MRGFQLIAAACAFASLCACNLLAVGSGESGSASRNGIASKAEGDRPSDNGSDRASRDRRGDRASRNGSGSDERAAEVAAEDREWILGRWGDAGCGTVLEFQSGGTLLIDGADGQWSLDGDTLTMSGNGGEQIYTVTRQSGGFSVEDADGNLQELGRC